MDRKEFVIILSDIHLGTNEPSVWYRKEIHEKYLLAILDDIIVCANQIQEIILLGDIFEFGLYPPNKKPPTIDDIIDAHPNILGPNGKLRQAISALKGRVVFLPGDHDLNLTKEDLDKIKSSDDYTMKYYNTAYIPLYNTSLLFTHGHEFTLLNAPYFKSRLAPLPIGYFVKRAITYTPQGGVQGLTDFFSEIPNFLINYRNGSDFVSGFMDGIAYYTGMPKDLPIQINETTAVSLNQAKKIYQNLVYDFYKNLKEQGVVEQKYPLNAFECDLHKTYLPGWIRKKAFGKFINTIVMGHSHSPVTAYGTHKFNYLNTGMMCPANLHSEPITYGIYSLSNRTFRFIKVTDNNPVNIHSNEDLNDKYKTTAQVDNEVNTNNGFTFGFSVFDASLEFWQIMQMGVLSKAEELGIHVITHDEISNPIEMITGSINLINQGIDALLIAPYTPEGVPFIAENANRNNIPVVVLDIGTGGADVAAFIVSDSFGGGIYAGEYALILIKKYDIKSKNVAIIKVQETAPYALLRGQGFKRVMEEQGYQVVAEPTANSVEEQAYEAMKRILESYADDLAVVFSENGTMALGAARAIDEAGKKGEIMLIGFDSGPSIIAGIKNGSIQGTIAQEPFQMGEIAVEVANSVLQGIPVTFDDSREKIILMEVYLINEDGEAVRSII